MGIRAAVGLDVAVGIGIGVGVGVVVGKAEQLVGERGAGGSRAEPFVVRHSVVARLVCQPQPPAPPPAPHTPTPPCTSVVPLLLRSPNLTHTDTVILSYSCANDKGPFTYYVSRRRGEGG